ncbi:Amyloid-beta A4 precursor protein-binding family A member 2 [Plecturocebus cupreus]
MMKASPRREEGITYYICYCPEDDSYLEGMDCNTDEYLVHGTHPMDLNICQEHPHNMTRTWTSEELGPQENCKAPSPSHHLASASAGAVPAGPFLSGPSAPFSGTGEEWLDWAGLHPHGHCAEGSQDYPDGHLPILEDKPSVLEVHEQGEAGHYCPSKEGYQTATPWRPMGTSAPPTTT